ncbi:MAG: MarR family transcriptional regulator [Candidatus Woesearchaeota archaeon]
MEEIEKDMKALLCKTMSNEKEPFLDVITILFLEPEEIALEEIAERTGYSLASVSNTMKMLENNGFVERIKKPKTKKVYFFMEKDLAKINLLKIKFISQHIKEVLSQLPIVIEKYSKLKNERNKKKLKIIENYKAQLIDFNSIVENWQKDLEKMMMKWQKQ